MDLESDQRILPNAPLAGYDDDFSTIGLKSFDRVRNLKIYLQACIEGLISWGRGPEVRLSRSKGIP